MASTAAEREGLQSVQAKDSVEARTVFVTPKHAADAKDFSNEEIDIRTIMSKLGPVIDVRSQFDTSIQRFGFSVEFAFVKAAQLAVQLDGIELRGRVLKIFSTVHANKAAVATAGGTSPFYASEEERERAEKAAIIDSYKHSALPHNHVIPEELRVMPILLPFMPRMLATPAQRDGEVAVSEGSEAGAATPSSDGLMDPVQLLRELAAAQADWCAATLELEAVKAELEKEKLAAASRATDLFALTLASGAPPQLHRTAYATAAVRVSRTYIVLDCPSHTSAAVDALEKLASKAPIRLYQLMPPLRLPPGEHRMHVGVEFADDDVLTKLGPEFRISILRPAIELSVVSASRTGLPGPLALAQVPHGWEQAAAMATNALRPPTS